MQAVVHSGPHRSPLLFCSLIRNVRANPVRVSSDTFRYRTLAKSVQGQAAGVGVELATLLAAVCGQGDLEDEGGESQQKR